MKNIDMQMNEEIGTSKPNTLQNKNRKATGQC